MGSLLSGTATATEIDLGEEGLQEGDDAGAYLANYIGDNREIVIPAGTYQYSTRAFTRGHGSGYADLVIRGEGEFGDVVFEHPDGYSFSEVIAANGGDVLLDNIVWRGVAGGNGNITVRAHGGDEVTLRRIARPDGSNDHGEGVFVRPEHTGVANFEHCWLENFTDNGLYGSAPGGSNGNDGEVNVYGGFYKNNNIANIRIGGSNSTIEGATVVLTDQQRGLWGSSRSVNMRGIWVREGTGGNGHNITIRDCDVYNELPYAPIEIHPRSGGGSGVVEDTRVYNEGGNAAIRHRGGDWSGQRNHATGSGNLRVEVGTNNCEGSRCDVASDVPRVPIGDREEGAEQDDDMPEMDPHLVTFITAEDAPVSEYRFIADGPIDALADSPYDSPSGNAIRASSNYEITQDDGQYLVEGSSANGYGDAFEVYGSISEAAVSSSDMVIELDGDRVDGDELVERTQPPEEDVDEGETDETESSDDTDDSAHTEEGPADSDDGSLSNVIVIDGSASDGVSQYVLTVSGDLERSEAHTSIVNEGVAWDTLPSNVSGEKAIGVVGQGADGYRYSGNVKSVEVRGDAALHIDRE